MDSAQMFESQKSKSIEYITSITNTTTTNTNTTSISTNTNTNTGINIITNTPNMILSSSSSSSNGSNPINNNTNNLMDNFNLSLNSVTVPALSPTGSVTNQMTFHSPTSLNILMTSDVTSSMSIATANSFVRPALSWCSKCGQSTEITSQSKVYNNKNNFKFRKLFDFDESEVIIKTFSCALVDDILFQGTLYASQNYFCFYSRIANKQKKVIIGIEKILEITKEKTAGIFPNALAIKTRESRFLLSSFVYREVAFRCLTEVWAAHNADKFSSSWHLGDEDLADLSKDVPILDIEIEEDPTNLLSNSGNLLEPPDDIDYSPIDEDIPLNHYSNLKFIGSSSATLNRVNNESVPFSFNKFIKNTLIIFSKEHIQLGLAITILVFLTIYIILLAWKIHDFQILLLNRYATNNNDQCASINKNTCQDNLYSTSIKKPADLSEPSDIPSTPQKSPLLPPDFNSVIDNLKLTLTSLNQVIKTSTTLINQINQHQPHQHNHDLNQHHQKSSSSSDKQHDLI